MSVKFSLEPVPVNSLRFSVVQLLYPCQFTSLLFILMPIYFTSIFILMPVHSTLISVVMPVHFTSISIVMLIHFTSMSIITSVPLTSISRPTHVKPLQSNIYSGKFTLSDVYSRGITSFRYLLLLRKLIKVEKQL